MPGATLETYYRTYTMVRTFQYPQAGRERTLAPSVSSEEKDIRETLKGQVKMYLGKAAKSDIMTTSIFA